MNKEEIRFLEGDSVCQLLKDSEFMGKLNALYQESKNKTIFQSPGFIKSWYLTKILEFSPIAVISLSANRLEGAVFFAVKRERSGKVKKYKAKIVGVGEYDAEYQTWLVREGKEKEFLPKVFDLISNTYPKCKMVFRFIPYPECLSWLDENQYWKKSSVVQACRRPLMQMSHPDLNAVFKKKRFKAKYNRFNRAGKMELEEITELNRFKEVFDEVMVLYDFRQGSLFNKTPTKSNPLRGPLFFSLFEQNMLHVTVLKLDEDITSCIIGMKSEKWMHLSGLITYSPFYSKLSPGMVHLFILGKYLKNQGYEYFDLTPGDDGYKERMATNTDDVYELTVCKDTVFKSKRQLRKKFHRLLLSNGIRPMTFNLEIQRSKHFIQKKLNQIKNKIFPTKNNSFSNTAGPIEFEKNNIKHLLAYNDPLGTSRWDFLSFAFNKVESGETFLSWTDDKRLLACIWFTVSSNQTEEEGQSATFLQTDSYIHPKVLIRKEEITKLARSILPTLGHDT
ncbi:MAG: GNAT family N-acetyltransferase [Cyclobacteriaceae bacterium]